MDPVVSRAAAEGYELIPGMRDLVPPEQVEKMRDLGALLTAMHEVSEDWPGRLVALGHPLRWVGAEPVPSTVPSPGTEGAGLRFVETGEGLEVEQP